MTKRRIRPVNCGQLIYTYSNTVHCDMRSQWVADDVYHDVIMATSVAVDRIAGHQLMRELRRELQEQYP